MVDQRRRPPVATRHLDLTALEVCVAVELREPVRERERGVAKRPREGVTELRRLPVFAELDEEVGQRRPGESRLEQSDEERVGGEPDHEERDPADRLELDLAAHHPEDRREEEEGEHHECERERVHEQGDGAARRPSALAAAQEEHDDPRE